MDNGQSVSTGQILHIVSLCATMATGIFTAGSYADRLRNDLMVAEQTRVAQTQQIIGVLQSIQSEMTRLSPSFRPSTLPPYQRPSLGSETVPQGQAHGPT